MQLTQKQKKTLKGLGHSLHPLVTIADQGLKPTVIDATNEALDAHELIKIRLRSKDKKLNDKQLTELCDQTGATVINKIGYTALIFKRNLTNPRVEL